MSQGEYNADSHCGLVVKSGDPEDLKLRARNGTKMRIQGSDELVIDTNGESGREGCPAYHQVWKVDRYGLFSLIGSQFPSRPRTSAGAAILSESPHLANALQVILTSEQVKSNKVTLHT